MTWTAIDVFNLAWTQLWQVTLVALLVALISILLRTRRWHPALANSLWLLVLVKAVTPPIWSSVFGVFSWTEPKSLLGAKMASSVDAAGQSGPMAIGGSVALALLTVVWVVGCLHILRRQLASWRRLLRLISENRCPPNTALEQHVSTLAAQLGFKRTPRVIVTGIELGPALVGVWRPAIVLPNSLVEGSRWEEIEPIVAHELFHLRRRDTAVSILQLVASAIWWFHPLVRWAGKQVEEASERCVDLAVLHVAGFDVSRYCRTLLRVLETRETNSNCLMIAAPAVRGVSVTCERIRELADVPAKPKAWQRLTSLAAVGCLALVLLPGQPLDVLKKKCYPAGEALVENENLQEQMLKVFYVKQGTATSDSSQ